MAIGTTAAIIIGATAAAGAVGAAAIGARGASRAAQTQLEAQQQALDERRAAGQRAIALKAEALERFNLPGIMESPEGQALYEQLRQRREGVGVGYTPESISAETSAFAKQRRAGLTEQEIPLISSAASARGMGRSTIPVSQIGLAGQAAERDIESRVAQLTSESERQRAVDIQNAITQSMAMQESQTRAEQAEAGTKLTGEFNIADTELGISYQVADSIAQMGATETGYTLQQAAMWSTGIYEAFDSISQAYMFSNQQLLDSIEQQQEQRGATINIYGNSV